MKIKIFAAVILSTGFIFAQTFENRIDSLIKKMTNEEKILQLHKEGGMNTADNLNLNIPGFVMADGPHGVREGMAASFPVGIGIAATWDVDLAERVGKALGEEFRGKGKNQMLGPAMDMTRDPRNGRTPESGGEDPVLNALINASVIKGIQSTPVIATAKHYNCKHKQLNRTNNNYTLSQRLLMENYGLNFRKSVQDAGAFSVMSSYNLINGSQAAQNRNLLFNILRKSWGFPFYVVSDWGGIKNSEEAIKAGNDVCMGSDHYQNDLLNLVTRGSVPVQVIDTAVRNVLRTKILSGVMDYYPSGKSEDVNSTEHQKLCLEAGMKGIVLLQNKMNILPLNKDTINTIAVIGPNANVMQTDGTGSSWVTPYYSVSPRQGLENIIGSSKVLYAKGCEITNSFSSDFADAMAKAKQAQAVFFIGGLDSSQEGEGLDRANGSIELPGKQKEMIAQLASVNPNIIVVIISGGICGVSGFANNVKGIIQGFYPGQEGGNAIAKIIFGEYNPSGKLPVTLPQSDAQLGTEITDFDFTNDYGCGYRWFDKKGYTPQFAFGYGLSYTTFSMSDLSIPISTIESGKTFQVKVNVKNTGTRAGTETVQLYLSKKQSSVERSLKSLLAFKKVTLDAGQNTVVSFDITAEDLYYYNESASSYKVEDGTYTILAGNSSDNLPLQAEFTITQAPEKPDLQIANIYTIPRYPLPGDKVQFAATIVNRGTGSSPAGKIHQVLFKVNGTAISKSVKFNGSIPAGGMMFISGDSAVGNSIYWNAASVGTNNVEAIVNSGQEIEELYYNNNSAQKSFAVYTPPAKNYALKKKVYVSSIEGTGLEGNKAVDGSYGTRWSSAFSDPQYIMLKFDESVSFDQIKLYWEAAYGKEYYIQTSPDSLTWKTIYYTANGTGGIEDLHISGEGKFLRILGIKRATVYGYSLYEIELFNNAASDVGLDDANAIPKDFSLSQNFPNPFNAGTIFNYSLPGNTNVKIKIHDVIGETVFTSDLGYLQKGKHSFNWDGKNQNNQTIASGIYFYQVIIPEGRITRKMVLQK